MLSGVQGGDNEEELLRTEARPDESSEDEDEAWIGVLRKAVNGIGVSGGPDVG
jgi:hypothetical protein